jgi:hypothetical protein
MIEKERATLDEGYCVKAVLAIQTYVADKAYFAPGVDDGYSDTLIQSSVQNYQFTTTPAKLIETYATLWLSA